MDSIPDQGTEILHAVEQLGPGTTATEAHVPQLESLCTTMKKIPRATTKI